jgi:hypothetical protein
VRELHDAAVIEAKDEVVAPVLREVAAAGGIVGHAVDDAENFAAARSTDFEALGVVAAQIVVAAGRAGVSCVIQHFKIERVFPIAAMRERVVEALRDGDLA